MHTTELDPKKLRERFTYNPETGDLTVKGYEHNANRPRKTGKYRIASLPGKILVYAHRVAWAITHGEIPDGFHIDHINGDTQDNRIANLRLCDRNQNLSNRGLPKSNTSGYKGVIWLKRERKWFAAIWKANKKHNLGYYDCPKEAARAYDKAALELHGEFAQTNASIGTLNDD